MCISHFENRSMGTKDLLASRQRFIQSFPYQNVNKPAVAHAIASLIRPISFSSDALRFCAILIERKENGQFKPSRRLHEAKQSAVRRSRAIISPSIAVAYLHLYTQHYISIPAKRQAFFPSGERIPRFYSNREFQAKGLVNYHEKKYPDLEILSKYPSFFSSFLNRRGAGAQWRYRSGGKIG